VQSRGRFSSSSACSSPQLGHTPSFALSTNKTDWWVLTTANTAGTNGLTCLPKHGVGRLSVIKVPAGDIKRPGVWIGLQPKGRPRITPYKGKRGDRGVLVGFPSAAMIRRWASPTHARRLASGEYGP
jgi:hypothetical protein